MFFTNRKIYKNGAEYYAMLKPPGHLKHDNLKYYSHWLPVKKFLFVWIKNRKYKDFLLDIYGFEKIC